MINNKFIDLWTIFHVLITFCIGSTHLLSRNQAYPLLVGFEVFENVLGTKIWVKNPEGPINITSDMLFNILGYELGKKYGNKKI